MNVRRLFYQGEHFARYQRYRPDYGSKRQFADSIISKTNAWLSSSSRCLHFLEQYDGNGSAVKSCRTSLAPNSQVRDPAANSRRYMISPRLLLDTIPNSNEPAVSGEGLSIQMKLMLFQFVPFHPDRAEAQRASVPYHQTAGNFLESPPRFGRRQVPIRSTCGHTLPLRPWCRTPV